MSFFKTVVFAGVVIALLPSEREQQKEFQQNAVALTREAHGFCETRPNICLTRQEAWDAFKSKSAFALELGAELLWGHQDHRPSSSHSEVYTRETARQNDKSGNPLTSVLGNL